MAHRLPPRMAESLLRRLLRASPSSDFVMGDLREEYAIVRGRRSRLVALLWYWAQAVRVPVQMNWRSSQDGGIAAARGTRSGSRSALRGDLMHFELRQARRFLLRRPGFTAAVVLTVALAIAATTVAFAVVNGVLLQALPYEEPDGLVVVWERNIPRDRDRNVASPANFLAWRDRARSFERLGSAIASSTTLTGEGEPERIGLVQASASLFEMVGAVPLIGRLYDDDDDRAGAADVVVLSEGYWRRRFGADPAIPGRSILLGGNPYTVIGVLPARYDIPITASFGGTGTHDVWLPPRWSEEARTASGRFLQVFGRLSPGATLASARQEMSALAAELREEHPVRQAGWEVTVVSLREQIVGDVRTTLLVIFGAVCFVLLIACANVANLLLTRASARQNEMAVRSALGAGRGRLVRQLMMESLLLSMAGGAIGIALTAWLLRSLIIAAPDIPRLDTIGLNPSVLLFAFFATFTTALLFGLAPALHIANADVASWLKERGVSSGRRGGNRLRGGLVVAQVALSLVLLVGAGLLVRSFANRVALGVGFDRDRLLTVELQLPPSRYPEPPAQSLFYEQLVERVAAIPGVLHASAITFPPLTGPGSATSFWVSDRPQPPPGEAPTGEIRWVHRDYREVLGIPVLAGRFFDTTDRADAPLRVVINETGARQLWPGEDAVGKRIVMPWGDTLNAEVIGVVGDVRHYGPDGEVRTMLYWDHRQFRAFSQMSLIIRSAGDPGSVVPAIRSAVRGADPDLPLFNVRTMNDLYDQALARPRFATLSLGLFAVIALVLAGIGVYGVVAYATQQRAREIGIRMALGAERGQVVRMVLSQGMILIAAAVVLGAAGALALTRLLEGLVFNVSTTDPLTFVAMTLVLAAIALLACWLPARRASAIDPVAAIRWEG